MPGLVQSRQLDILGGPQGNGSLDAVLYEGSGRRALGVHVMPYLQLL
jgi:hypothetical protein